MLENIKRSYEEAFVMKNKAYRKFIASTMTAALVTAVVAPASSLAAPKFTDVKEGAWYAEAVNKLADKGIIKGLTETRFGVGQEITRAQAATLFVRALNLKGEVKNSPFRDVDAKHPHHHDIVLAAEAGLIRGKTADTFGPQETLTRAQMASLIVRAFELKSSQTKATPFTDIANNGHKGDIETLYSLNLVSGVTERTYSPTGKVTRDAFAVFLYRAMEFKNPVEKEPEQPVKEAVVNSVKAENGKVIVTFSNELTTTPKADDFKITSVINKGTAKNVKVDQVSVRADKKTVELTIDKVEQTFEDQSVVLTVAYKAEQAKSVEFKVEALKAGIISATPLNGTQVKLVFNKDVTSAYPGHFTVVRKDASNIRAFVTDVEIGSNKKEVILTFTTKLTDDKTYELTADGLMSGTEKIEKSSIEFNYLKSTPASIEFTDRVIIPGKNIRDILKVTDQLGRDITKEVELEIQSSDTSVINARGLAIDKNNDRIADTAIVKVYVKGTNVSTANTAVTVSREAPRTFVGFHIGDNLTNKTTEDFEKMKAEDVVRSISMGEYSKYLNMFYTDQFGDKKLDAQVGSEVTYTNLNPEIVYVDRDGKIIPYSQGVGAVKVKAGEVETVVNISVLPAAFPTDILFDKDVVYAAVDSLPSTLEISLKDQFGKKLSFDAAKLTVRSSDETIARAYASTSYGQQTAVSYDIQAFREGSAYLTVTYHDGADRIDRTISVYTTKAGSMSGYKVEVDNKKLDANATSSTANASNTAKIKVYEVDQYGNKLKLANANITFANDTATREALSYLDLSYNGPGEYTLTVRPTLKRTTEARADVRVGDLVIETITFDLLNASSSPSEVRIGSQTFQLQNREQLETRLKQLIRIYDQNKNDITSTFNQLDLNIEYDVINPTNGFNIDKLGNIDIVNPVSGRQSTGEIRIKRITYGTSNEQFPLVMHGDIYVIVNN